MKMTINEQDGTISGCTLCCVGIQVNIITIIGACFVYLKYGEQNWRQVSPVASFDLITGARVRARNIHTYIYIYIYILTYIEIFINMTYNIVLR